MGTYTPNLNLYKPDSSDDLSDFRTEFNDNMDKIDQSGGGGGGGGHTIVDEDGNDMPQEAALQFTGNVTVTDDNVNGRTVVNVSGGGNGLIVDAQIYSDTEKVVGVWRDGKPLYQKTITYHDSTGQYSELIIDDISSLDIDTFVNAFGSAYEAGWGWGSIPSDGNFIRYNTTNGNLQLDTSHFSWSNADYYITVQYTKTTDTAGSGGYEAYGFTPVIYSDTERKIGVWRDNKPLYQRTFDLGSDLSISYSAWISSGVTLTNVENLITAYGTRSDYSFQGYVLAWNDNTDLKLTTPRNGNNSFIRYLTIQYTKTTDVAGSGDYNTYGVPTVHYSTSEQVVGTWVDGKPIYQKTIAVTSNIPYNTWQNTGVIVDANADRIINVPQARPQSGTGNMGFLAYVASGVLMVMNMRNVDYGNNFPYYITVQYTKSTD